MKFLSFIIIFCLSACSTNKKSTVVEAENPIERESPKLNWIIDEYPLFDIHWSMVLYARDKGGDNSKIISLTKKDIDPNEKWTKLLSDPASQMRCRFERKMTPTDHEGVTAYHAIGDVKCEIGELKIIMDPVQCFFGYIDEKNEKYENLNSFTSTIIKTKKKSFMLGSGCNIIKK